MIIDLRSDTFTKPTPDMKSAMFNAEVGDDVFGEDPTVNELEAYAAQLFNMEAALFCPSGTMTNQIAINVHTRPGDEVICHEFSHVYKYEGGGMAKNSSVSARLITGNKGRLTAQDVYDNINPTEDPHAALTRVVSLENTSNKGGGCYYEWDDILAIRKACNEHGLSLHLDGARLFNAYVETPQSFADYGTTFDSISICLSKGLGTPIGSLLLGDAAFIKRARRVRKSFGGGMRQAGFIAAAGLYALQHNVDRLKEDHANARKLGEALRKTEYVKQVLEVDTNIVVFEIADEYDSVELVQKFATKGMKIVPFGKQTLRMVTHLDITSEMIERGEEIICELLHEPL